MVSLILSATLPMVSVLLGAALTYWLNIRTRRRTYVEDLFNQAISAVAVADASQHYLSNICVPDYITEDEVRDLRVGIARAAVESHLQRCGEAREAMAKVLPYEPAVRPFYQDAEAVLDKPEEILKVLTAARDRRARSRQGPRRVLATGLPARR